PGTMRRELGQWRHSSPFVASAKHALQRSVTRNTIQGSDRERHSTAGETEAGGEGEQNNKAGSKQQHLHLATASYEG
ncbi:hypothetical protein JOQ06_012387, partial [Pogonophryne albipinna]